MKKKSVAAKVREYMVKHPEAKPREIAAALRVNVRNVYAAKYNGKAEVAVVQEVETLPNIVRQSVLPGIDDITLSFIQMNLTKDELVGFLRGCAITHSVGTSSVDAAKASWYADRLRSVLAS